jgi:hypothetical protein
MARNVEWLLLATLVIVLLIFSALARAFVRMAPLHDDASKALTNWLETIERLALAATALIGIVLGCFALSLKRSGRTLTTEYADVDGVRKIDADEGKPYTSADVQPVQVWLIDADNVRALLGWPPTAKTDKWVRDAVKNEPRFLCLQGAPAVLRPFLCGRFTRDYDVTLSPR